MKVSAAETTAISLQQDLRFAFLGQDEVQPKRKIAHCICSSVRHAFSWKWFKTLLSHLNCCLSCSVFFRKLYCWNSAWFQLRSSCV